MKSKTSWLPTVLAGCGWLGGIALYILLLFTMPRQPWITGLLFLLPAALLTAVTVLSEQRIVHGAGTIIGSILITAVGIIGGFLLLLWLSIETAIHPVTDPGQYQRILGLCGYPEEETVAFFPPEIPATATDITFSYCTPLLQGGEELSLQFTLLKEQAEQLKAEIEALPDCPAPDYLREFDFSEAENGRVWYSRSYQPGDWNHGELGAVFWKDNTFWYTMQDW